MSERLQKIKESSKRIEHEIRSKIIGYILTAMGIVAGLAWNDAINAVILHFFPAGKDTVLAKIIYAFLITIVVVTLSLYLTKLIKKEENAHGNP